MGGAHGDPAELGKAPARASEDAEGIALVQDDPEVVPLLQSDDHIERGHLAGVLQSVTEEEFSIKIKIMHGC